MENRQRVFVVAIVALAAVLGFSYWYMLMCEGNWEGMTLEAGMGSELGAIEDSLRADIFYLSETIGPRHPAKYASLAAAADWITETWEAQGYQVRHQTFLVEGNECANIEIEITGQRAPTEIVIVGAQYDTWPECPGANNNGSGVAVLLRLGDMLKEYKPDRTVRLVAFTTQQHPYDNTELMGSLRYARRSKERGENIRVMLSMDAVGIYKDEPGTQKIPFPFSLFYPDRGNFLAFIADLGTRPRVVEATRGFKKASSHPIEAASVPGWVKGASWSDHASFWKYGYAGIQVTDTGAFRASSHGKSNDTMEKINFEALARVAIGIYGAVLELTSIEGS
jgi:hypothetical protein